MSISDPNPLNAVPKLGQLGAIFREPAARPTHTLSYATPRVVRARYMQGPKRHGGGGLHVVADAFQAVGMLLDDLAISPDWLIVRTIDCDGPKLALKLVVPRGGRGRVLALLLEGLTSQDANAALLWWSNGGPDAPKYPDPATTTGGAA